MREDVAQEGRQQILELILLAENPRLLERAARREGLERLNEAVRADARQELLDRPRTTLDKSLGRASLARLPEAQRRHEHVQHLAGAAEGPDLAGALRSATAITVFVVPKSMPTEMSALMNLSFGWEGGGPPGGSRSLSANCPFVEDIVSCNARARRPRIDAVSRGQAAC
jgi:hypothetical protein